MTRPDLFAGDVARHYDADAADVSTPAVLGPTVDLLAALAGEGPVLEFALGTGRVALPLSERVEVHGIEYSADMLAQCAAKPGAARITAHEGDMATLRVPGGSPSSTSCSTPSATSPPRTTRSPASPTRRPTSRPGGRFLVEVGVPDLQRLPFGERFVPFDVSERHVGVDEYDTVDQGLVSHHVNVDPDGTVRRASPRFRYVWPAELDLMARLAGMTREHRWAGFDRSPFTATSRSHVSVWRTGG